MRAVRPFHLTALLLGVALAACHTVEEPDAGDEKVLDVQVSVEPQVIPVHYGGTVAFAAAVDGDPAGAVKWSVLEGPPGGSIDAAGIYTAPWTPGTFTVVATSVANPRRRATAEVTVGEVAITLAPETLEAPQGDTIDFAATVTGTWDTAVTWTAEVGEISADGIYQVPHREGTFDVTATSVADPTKSASTPVVVQELLVSLDPWAVTMDQGESVQLAAVLDGTTDGRVTWSAEVGSVSEDGLYTAPFFAGTFPVRATSVTNPRKSAAASVTVQAVTVLLTPWWVELDQGGSLQIEAVLEGTVDQRVTWSASGGEVTAEGLYTAPHAPGDVHVTAASVGDPNGKGTMTVRVREVGVEVEPSWIQLGPGAGTTFVATVRGTTEAGVQWSADAGTIGEGGFYTAPIEPGVYTVTATSLANESRLATAAVHVVAPAAALGWDDPAEEEGWRLVENPVRSSADRLVLDLVGPGASRIDLRLALAPAARFANLPGSEALASGAALVTSASLDDGALVLEAERERIAEADEPLLSFAIECPCTGRGPLALEVLEAVVDGTAPIDVAVGTLRLE
ncbi:hypothetical protein [Vulgatibacter sp.]|uniref:hypothetical protein n=1 Tax=Vulgatibacter sp. TaxID=1971226 RepID=UPI00356AC9AB